MQARAIYIDFYLDESTFCRHSRISEIRHSSHKNANTQYERVHDQNVYLTTAYHSAVVLAFLAQVLDAVRGDILRHEFVVLESESTIGGGTQGVVVLHMQPIQKMFIIQSSADITSIYSTAFRQGEKIYVTTAWCSAPKNVHKSKFRVH